MLLKVLNYSQNFKIEDYYKKFSDVCSVKKKNCLCPRKFGNKCRIFATNK